MVFFKNGVLVVILTLKKDIFKVKDKGTRCKETPLACSLQITHHPDSGMCHWPLSIAGSKSHNFYPQKTVEMSSLEGLRWFKAGAHHHLLKDGQGWSINFRQFPTNESTKCSIVSFREDSAVNGQMIV